jgi:hypothetical protein
VGPASIIGGSRRAACVAAATVAVALAAAPATAEPLAGAPCEEHIDDPVPLPWREGGVDAPRGACLHAELSARLGGHALIDTPGFYGTLGGELTLAARVVESSWLEWGLGLRLLDGVFVQNAVLSVTELGYGPVSAHVAIGADGSLAGRRARRAAYVRADVPFTRASLDSHSGALQLGVAETLMLGPRLRLHAHVAVLGWYGASTGGRVTRASVSGSLDAAWRPIRWMTLLAGADVQGGWYGLGLDHVAARVATHWRVRGLWRAEFAAGLPLAGAERTDLGFALGVRRDLD